MMFAILTAVHDDAEPQATAVHGQSAKGVRIDYGPVHLSLSAAEAVDLVDTVVAAFSNVESSADTNQLVLAIDVARGSSCNPEERM